ncbi:MAG: TorD/DmsD family molecular chaperone [Desulfobacteria bacterium]
MEEMILRERMRGDCYRFLSACFCQPQKNVFQEEKLLQNLTKSLQRICPEAALFSASMEESILKYGNEELLVEYSRLFIGPFGVIAPPYGSVYLDGERRVMGDSTMEVIGMYRNEGLSGNAADMDLPDHVAVELEFMSFLVFREIKALEASDLRGAVEAVQKQERFSGEFLRRWIPPFCEKIKENTENAFYAALAQCASTFIGSSSPADLRAAAGAEKSIASR